MPKNFYVLPELPYGYVDLAPVMSEELLKIHHDKHHAAYVAGANAILEKMDKAHTGGAELDPKAELKALSFNIGGHVLHSLFWENLAPANNGGGGEPGGKLAEKIKEDFGGFENFKAGFIKIAMTVEGSGWAALTYCLKTNRLIPMQVEKHNTNLYPNFKIIMAIDAFEHAYYLDYKNDKARFFEAIWSVINWKIVDERYKQVASL
ncbi:MAG: superoxide dismutase [Patescibacteria group bacterium]|jgi:Fe-Mn family superoxide dismutase